MTCCFQGWYHGNTEEDGRLDSASPRRKGGGEERPGGCGGKVVGWGWGSGYHFTVECVEMMKSLGGFVLSSGAVGVHGGKQQLLRFYLWASTDA